jgi:hypothetical protein
VDGFERDAGGGGRLGGGQDAVVVARENPGT